MAQCVRTIMDLAFPAAWSGEVGIGGSEKGLTPRMNMGGETRRFALAVTRARRSAR